jgi:hypothetical protein
MQSVSREGPRGHVPTCGERGESCRLRVVGYLQGPSPAGVECDRPLRTVCGVCGSAGRVWRCSNHRESRCKPCAARYRRRLLRVADSGMGGRRSGMMALLTFTAPSAAGAHCKRAGCKALDGRCGHELCPCTPVGGVDLAEWNASHSRRWNHLLTLMRRRYPHMTFMRGVEVQQRGALHDHAIAWSPTCPFTVSELRSMAMAAGFGHSVDVAPCVPGSRKAGYYVSKYVTKSCDQREEVPWKADVVDLQTGEITREVVRARYRTWSMGRQWGLTMKEIRLRCQEQAIEADGRRQEKVLCEAVRVAQESLCRNADPPS